MLGRGRRAIVAAALVAALACAPSPSSGKEIVGFVGGAPDAQRGGRFVEPSDVAIYRGRAPGPADDNLLVVEAGMDNARVQRLDAYGNFEAMWGRDVVRSGVLADKGDRHEVCSAAAALAGWCKAAPPGDGAGELAHPTAIAVNDETGHVYVMDEGNHRIQEFGLDGRFVRAWGWGVNSGAAALEVCTGSCGAGRMGRREGDANAGQLALAPNGSIAVSPVPPHDVFVGDAGNNRILQFHADGKLVRAWGWGVATGAPRFETCDAAVGCRRGHRGRLKTDRVSEGYLTEGWPRHLAVDRDGVVYSSEAPHQATRLVRFNSKAPGDPGDADEALLEPLAEDVLTAGSTYGLDIDLTTGNLVAVIDPFGPTVVDEIRHPAGSAGTRPSAVHVPLGFIKSVNGIASAGGLVYVAKSARLVEVDSDSTFGRCGERPGRPSTCHGLIAVGEARPSTAVLLSVGGSAGTEAVSSVIDPGDMVQYRLETSVDGDHWRPTGRWRYLAGSSPTRINLSIGDVKTVRAVRLSMREWTRTGTAKQASNSVVVAPSAMPRTRRRTSHGD